MAKFTSSPYGNIRQTMGDTVAYASRGQNIMRTRASSYKDLNSLAQRRNRAALKMAANFAASFKGMLPLAFPALQPGQTAFSAFIGVNHPAIKAAIVQDGGTGSVDDMIEEVGFNPINLIISQGNLAGELYVAELERISSISISMEVVVDDYFIEQNPNATVYAGFYDAVKKVIKFKAGSELTNSIQIAFDGRLPVINQQIYCFCFATSNGKSTVGFVDSFVMPAT